MNKKGNMMNKEQEEAVGATDFAELASADLGEGENEFDFAPVDESADDVEVETQGDESAETEEPVEGAETEETAESETTSEDAAEAEAAPEKVEDKPEVEAEATTVPETEAELGPEEREAQEQQLQQFRVDAENLLAQQVYSMTDEQVAEFEDDPKVALPKLAARLHMEAMNAATNNVMRLLPQMIQEVTQQQSSAKQFEDQFHEAWPDLKGDTEAVMRVGAVYRQMNPQATPEDFIRDVGAQVMVALGKHQQAVTETPAAEEPTVAPHKPAGRGAGAKVAPAPVTNEFALMATEEL